MSANSSPADVVLGHEGHPIERARREAFIVKEVEESLARRMDEDHRRLDALEKKLRSQIPQFVAEAMEKFDAAKS